MGLRNHLNTQPEFADYHLNQPMYTVRRNNVQVNQDAVQAPGPAPDMDGFDDPDVVEDDDMGDGSEIALDPGNFGANDHLTNGVNHALIPPPPPPPHHPNLTFQSYILPPHLAAAIGAELPPSALDDDLAGPSTNGSPGPGNTGGPSTAGQGQFANQGPGPSTASMSRQAEGDDENGQS